MLKEFDITRGRAGLVVSAGFIGRRFGAWFWGGISDEIGRRTGFQITVAIFAVFGIASVFAPDATWLGVGGLLIPISFVAALTVFAVSFLVGAIVVAVFATETRDQPLTDSLVEEPGGSTPGAALRARTAST